MKLTELFKRGEFVVTSEVGPVKGCCRPEAGAEDPGFLREAESIRDYVHAVNVTDNQSARMRLGSLAAGVMLKTRGIEPIYQLTCRDRNRLALQSDLLSACSLGIDNVLCLTGDHLKKGDHPTAKGVFDLDSVQLLKIARGLNEGFDMMGQPLDLQLLKMEKKIAQGAQFFQTQTVYDPGVFETFIRKAQSFGVPIQYGIVIIKSPKMARYMNENVSGVSVPLTIIDEFAATPPELYKAKAREITARLLGEIAPMVQGVHFMPLGWSDLIPQLVDRVRGFCRCGGG
jgi:5,10-methylenetetrahydrofolate reductase